MKQGAKTNGPPLSFEHYPPAPGSNLPPRCPDPGVITRYTITLKATCFESPRQPDVAEQVIVGQGDRQ
jgi:hypothetical protein